MNLQRDKMENHYEKFLKWLGYDGIAYLTMIMDEMEGVTSVWMNGRIPHAFHFKEGMTIRNWLRNEKVYPVGIELDDVYEQFIKNALNFCMK